MQAVGGNPASYTAAARVKNTWYAELAHDNGDNADQDDTVQQLDEKFVDHSYQSSKGGQGYAVN